MKDTKDSIIIFLVVGMIMIFSFAMYGIVWRDNERSQLKSTIKVYRNHMQKTGSGNWVVNNDGVTSFTLIMPTGK